MSEHTLVRNSTKNRAQDLAGIMLCMVGGFSAVSIVLAMRGQESTSLLARPVEGLMKALGGSAALLVSIAFAVLGMVMFLRHRALAANRHLFGLAAVGLGAALMAGGIDPLQGGFLGGAVPEAIPGIAGRLTSFAIGVTILIASTWVLWIGRFGRHASKPATMAVILPTRPTRQALDGVSAAEAQALQGVLPIATPGERAGSSPKDRQRGPLPASGPQPSAPDAPIRIAALPSSREGLRHVATHAGAIAAPREPAGQDLATPGQREEPLGEGSRKNRGSSVQVVGHEGEVAKPALPAPSWEADFEAIVAEEEDPREGVAEDIPPGLEFDQEAESRISTWTTELAEGPEESAAALPMESQAIEQGRDAARWEQVGLFDEESSSNPSETAGEQAAILEKGSGDRAAAASAEDDADVARDEEDELSYMLTPRREEGPRADEAELSSPGQSEERELSNLVFEAGCLILDENRVAVSMLQRRFGLDFDQACDVLDRLQKVGLIGAYVGGRSREILLTREEWETVAPA